MTNDKAYDRSPLGLEDHADFVPAKPCARRLNTIPLSWCGLPQDHEDACHADPVRPIESDDLGPGASKRRRW